MQFAFADDQLAFRDAVRDLLDKECTPAHVRDAWTQRDRARARAVGPARRRWASSGCSRPKPTGGLGLDVSSTSCSCSRRPGRHAVPEPIVETAAFGVPLLGRADLVGRDRARARAVGRHRRRRSSPTDGRVRPPRRSTLVPRPSVDGARRLFEVRGDVRTGRRRSCRRVSTAASCGIAAQQCGLADRMLELTVDYVKERQPVRRAGRLVPGGEAPPRERAHRARVRAPARLPRRGHARRGRTSSMAKAEGRRGRAARRRSVALQCHGAIGYTTEYDLHLYMKRAWALARSWGDARLAPGPRRRAIL